MKRNDVLLKEIKNEYADVLDKISRLTKFMATSEFDTVPEGQKELLKQQALYMYKYSQVLYERLAYLDTYLEHQKEKEEKEGGDGKEQETQPIEFGEIMLDMIKYIKRCGRTEVYPSNLEFLETYGFKLLNAALEEFRKSYLLDELYKETMAEIMKREDAYTVLSRTTNESYFDLGVSSVMRKTRKNIPEIIHKIIINHKKDLGFKD